MSDEVAGSFSATKSNAARQRARCAIRYVDLTIHRGFQRLITVAIQVVTFCFREDFDIYLYDI